MRQFPTRQEFLAWRAAHPRTGEIASPKACPIARYLTEVMGYENVSVGGKTFDAEGIRNYVMPKWAIHWIAQFDGEL